MMIDPKNYTYRITWSPEDEEFVGLCAEFPSLSCLDENQVDALKGISELVADVVSDMEAKGETPPEPIANGEYSGKFQVRATPQLHRQLVIEAAEQNVSLNRHINTKLARA
nr:toxin-antitoxin system HicB family antitoxin [Dactylococcopsis salina]